MSDPNVNKRPDGQAPRSGDMPDDAPDLEMPENDEDHAALLDEDLKKLQEERDALFEQVARVQADFRNAQKRLEQEKLSAIQFANTRLIQALLPVIDNFERALEVDPEKTDVGALLEGMQMVHDQLITVLRQQSVEVIDPEPGSPFDPNLHAALMQQPDERYEEPAITQVFQRGYSVFGRVLRPAQVAVGKRP